jgi:hypothetical protein
MQLSTCLQTLHAQYADLALAGKRSLSEDQARSLACYRAERAVIEDPAAFAGTTDRSLKWALLVQELEKFVATRGRLPHQNNKLALEYSDPDEWKLCERLRYLQGRGLNEGRLCGYQRRRHACIPGFREHPREADWESRLQDYRNFLDTHRRAPRYRAEDANEKRLAAWAAKQRTAYRAGTLSQHRIRRLVELGVWWGRNPN